MWLVARTVDNAQLGTCAVGAPSPLRAPAHFIAQPTSTLADLVTADTTTAAADFTATQHSDETSWGLGGRHRDTLERVFVLPVPSAPVGRSQP